MPWFSAHKRKKLIRIFGQGVWNVFLQRRLYKLLEMNQGFWVMLYAIQKIKRRCSYIYIYACSYIYIYIYAPIYIYIHMHRCVKIMKWNSSLLRPARHLYKSSLQPVDTVNSSYAFRLSAHCSQHQQIDHGAAQVLVLRVQKRKKRIKDTSNTKDRLWLSLELSVGWTVRKFSLNKNRQTDTKHLGRLPVAVRETCLMWGLAVLLPFYRRRHTERHKTRYRQTQTCTWKKIHQKPSRVHAIAKIRYVVLDMPLVVASCTLCVIQFLLFFVETESSDDCKADRFPK